MAKKATIPKIKVMVASTIFGYQDQLEQICATLQGYKYEVWNSHMKTIPVHPGLSNTENCLRAVESCDVFFGIIRSRYGAVPGGELSITHQEMLCAIELKKPRWFIVHRDISIARQLLKQYMYLENGDSNPTFSYRRTEVLDDIQLINLYNATILNDVAPEDRVGHWVDEFFRVGDILNVIKTQFSDQKRVREIIEQMKVEAP
ncbi:DUF4062 domain-containing protein [Maribacter chungangensis]|mgnify:CR=1 FL=1|jgi:hypothetical protein|uniref:DUF4062 domain-containing protein n=1 Tax=Maribacter chungangensis TaxID=1069117 RepID=A0ABW3B6R4_9FLAO